MPFQNWFELPVVLPPHLVSWVANNEMHIGGRVTDVPEPHLTLLYGFEPIRYSDVARDVASFKIDTTALTFGEPRKGTEANVWLVDVTGPKLQECFWFLHGKYENQHTLFNGHFEPHVTLCWFEPDEAAAV